MLTFLEGFESYAGVVTDQAWTNMVSAPGRGGGRAMRISLQNQTTPQTYLSPTFDTGITEVWAGFAVNMSGYGAGPLLGICTTESYPPQPNQSGHAPVSQVSIHTNSVNQLEARLGDPGASSLPPPLNQYAQDDAEGVGYPSLKVLGRSTASLNPGTWYYVEVRLKLHASNGTCVVRINDTNVISLFGINTIWLSSAPQITNLQIYPSLPTGVLFDDVYANYTPPISVPPGIDPGVWNGAFLGSLAVEGVSPVDYGARNDFFPNGDVDNWRCVNQPQVLPNILKSSAVLLSPQVGQTYNEVYEMAPLAKVVGTVFGVKNVIYARGTNKFLGGFAMAFHTPEMQPNELHDNGILFNFGLNHPNNRVTLLPLSFDTLPWTTTKVNATQWGVRAYSSDNPSPI